ncbi:spindle assembly abnormal protein 6 homolog isoform X2 [Penaeus indicus]|uniref:spindle assembly abnormal protein 6 homolog isoform X2 n=1 Tax=Penaeus indicus TaxID=29960 RepID=UPI00300CA3E0
MESLGGKSGGDILANCEVCIKFIEAGCAVAAATVRRLRLLVELRGRTTGTSKELLVRLTDDSDPFFLFTCIVCEEDYHGLRQSQGLLIDFSAFPHKFVELVNTCIRESGKDSPKFVLALRCSDSGGDNAALEVVEVNIFKHLCHLSLTLTPASTQLKLSHLAECCKALKAEVKAKEREAEENAKQLESQLRNTQDILAKTSREAQELRSELNHQIALSSEKQAQLINQEKDKLLKVQSDADRRADRERRDLEAKMSHRIDQLQAKVSSLTAQNSELLEKKQRAEGSVKELRGRLSSAEGNLERCRQELGHTKKINAHLDKDYHSKSSAVRELESRVSQLEGELRSKDTSLGHAQEMLESLQQQKRSLEETVEEKQQKLAKRENSIQMLYAELQKSLDVIKKLQKKIKEEHMTSNVRGAALMEQDKLVTEKDSKVAELSEQVQQMATKLSQLTLDNEKLLGENREAKEKLLEHEKTLETNEKVISWLNKQLNETEIAGAVIKRAPLTEAYLTSQSHGVQGPRFPSSGLPTELAHSTPLSNTLHSLPTLGSSGRSGGGHSTNSLRTFGHIPPIPEEISPRTSHVSPTEKDISPVDKENVQGLDPKYFEPTGVSAVQVHGLLRANYQRSSLRDTGSQPRDFVADGKQGERREGRGGGRGRGGAARGGRGRGVGERKPTDATRKFGTSTSRASNYFPRS